jgi:hypothetical protein
LGDHAWTKVTCRPEHRAAFEEVGFDDESESLDSTLVPGALALVNDQANYAADSELREIAKKGIPFYAVHAAGDEYGEGCYAADGKRLIHVDCVRNGGPAVEVGDDGEPDADQLHLVHDYQEVLAAAKKAIAEGLPPGFRWKSADEILRAMDPALFREQRRLIIDLVESASKDRGDGGHRADLLDGLDSLLADLADFAHNVLGMNCLLEEPETQAEGE